MDNKRVISQLTDSELSALMNWRVIDKMGLRQIAIRADIDYREIVRFFKEADAEATT